MVQAGMNCKCLIFSWLQCIVELQPTPKPTVKPTSAKPSLKPTIQKPALTLTTKQPTTKPLRSLHPSNCDQTVVPPLIYKCFLIFHCCCYLAFLLLRSTPSSSCHCGIDTATFGIAVWCKMKQRTQKQSYDIDDTACWSRSSSSGTHLTRRIWTTPYVVLGGAHSGTNSTYLLWVVNGWRTDCTTHEVHGPRAGQRTNKRAVIIAPALP